MIALQADALALPLAAESVDLIVTSPPYFGQRTYEQLDSQIGNEARPSVYVNALVAATREMARVTRKTGSIFVNLGDKYASYEANRGAGRLQDNRQRPVLPGGYGLTGQGEARNKSLMGVPARYLIRCLDDLGLVLRAEIIWHKSNGQPESTRDRARRTHEVIYHFTRSDRYFHNRHTDGSVWCGPVARSGTGHPAPMPSWIPRRAVEGWCPPTGVVLDPFGGGGTVAAEATRLGRRGVSIDLSAAYCAAAGAGVS